MTSVTEITSFQTCEEKWKSHTQSPSVHRNSNDYLKGLLLKTHFAAIQTHGNGFSCTVKMGLFSASEQKRQFVTMVRLLGTVTAIAITPEEKAALEGAGRRDEDDLLLAIQRQTGLSMNDYAVVLNWKYATGYAELRH